MVVLHPTLPPRSSSSANDSAPHQVPESITNHLLQIPWCAAILKSPEWIPLRSHSRNPPPRLTGRYSFMSRTMSTPETVPIWQGFYRRVRRGPGSEASSSSLRSSPSSPRKKEEEEKEDKVMPEVLILLQMGDGLDGHLHTAHGGVAAALLDEAMGVVCGMHRQPGTSTFTAFLHVNYRKPLPTPGTIRIRAWLDADRSRGRKMFVKGVVEGVLLKKRRSGSGGAEDQEDEEEVVVYNEAEALFLEVERKKPSKVGGGQVGKKAKL